MSNIKLDDIFQNYGSDSFIEDVIYEKSSSIESESRRKTFNVWRNFKENSSVLKILFQQVMFNFDERQATNNEYKVAITYQSNLHQNNITEIEDMIDTSVIGPQFCEPISLYDDC